MTMTIVNGNPTYDNQSEYDEAHGDWLDDGWMLHCEKDAFLYEGGAEDLAKLEAEHMARQPALTWEAFIGYDPADMRELENGTERIPF